MNISKFYSYKMTCFYLVCRTEKGEQKNWIFFSYLAICLFLLVRSFCIEFDYVQNCYATFKAAKFIDDRTVIYFLKSLRPIHLVKIGFIILRQ